MKSLYEGGCVRDLTYEELLKVNGGWGSRSSSSGVSSSGSQSGSGSGRSGGSATSTTGGNTSSGTGVGAKGTDGSKSGSGNFLTRTISRIGSWMESKNASYEAKKAANTGSSSSSGKSHGAFGGNAVSAADAKGKSGNTADETDSEGIGGIGAVAADSTITAAQVKQETTNKTGKYNISAKPLSIPKLENLESASQIFGGFFGMSNSIPARRNVVDYSAVNNSLKNYAKQLTVSPAKSGLSFENGIKYVTNDGNTSIHLSASGSGKFEYSQGEQFQYPTFGRSGSNLLEVQFQTPWGIVSGSFDSISASVKTLF